METKHTIDQKFMIPKIEINHEKCDKEGLCVRVCVEGIFEQSEQHTVPIITHPERCFFCGHCVAVCPGNAITHTGFEMENFLPHTPEMFIEPDNLLGFLRMRRSLREYHPDRRVPKEKVEQVIDAARYAPTGSNAQSLEHIVITDQKTMDKLAEYCIDVFHKRVDLIQNEDVLTDRDPRVAKRIQAELPFYTRVFSDYKAGKAPFFYKTPVLIITHADMTNTPTPVEDATLASYQMMLMAHSLGLGTCYIGNFYEYANESQSIRDLLEIPPDHDILMSFTLGYPAIKFRKLVDRNETNVRWF